MATDPTRINFTKEAIARLSCPAGKDRTYFYDRRTPGLTVCVTSAGGKTYYLYKRVGVKPERIRLGGFDEIALEQARKLAQKVNGQIADGVDPMEQRRTAKGEITLGQAFDYYINHARQYSRSADKNQERYDRHLAGWANRRMKDITRQAVQSLHAKISEKKTEKVERIDRINGQEVDRSWTRQVGGPGVANRVLSLLSVIFNKARNLGYEGPNPCEGAERNDEHGRERFLSADELQRFYAAMETEPQPWRDFFELCLLTGARSGNVKAARWVDFDLTGGVWRIPASEAKANEQITLPLSPDALEILQRRIKASKPDSEYVFPAPTKTGHIQEPKKRWAKLCQRANLTDLWIHDLRRTFGSWQAASGVSLPIIGKSLGHRQQSTTQIYARLSLDPVREAINKATVAMMAAAKRTAKKA